MATLAWPKTPIKDTEPRVQRFFDGSYPERGMGLKNPAVMRGFVLKN